MVQLPFKKRAVLTDQQLIAGCLQGDRKAQESLYNRYAPRLLGVCLRYLPRQEEAEDVMQEAFVRIFEKLYTFRGDANLQTWMIRIAVNLALNHLRSRRQLILIEADQEQTLGIAETQPAYHSLDAQVVMQAIGQLPDGYRAVINLFSIEGYSHAEIGQMLGISESTSRSQFSRARQLLDKKLQALHQISKP